MKIVWVGFHEEGRYCIPKLHESGFSIEAIITLDEEELKKRSSVFDYSFQSEKYSIPIYKVNNINDSVAVEIISNIKPDVICVIGWSQILSAHILDQADLVIGAHASLLPHNRGSAPINWSLINGEKITGNTFHFFGLVLRWASFFVATFLHFSSSSNFEPSLFVVE